MQKWLIKIVICAVNAFIIAYIIPHGVEIRDMYSGINCCHSIICALMLFKTFIGTAYITPPQYYLSAYFCL